MGRNPRFWVLVLAFLSAMGGLLFWSLMRPKTQMESNSKTEVIQKKKPHSWSRFERLSSKNSMDRAGEELKAQALMEQNLENLISLLHEGRDQEFVDNLDRMIKENPDIPELWALRADFYYALKNWDETEKSLQEVLRLDPSNEFAQTSLGEVTAILGKFDEGFSRMKGVLETNPSNLEALYGVLSISEMQERPEVGAAMIRDLYERNPSSANIAMVLSDILASEKNWGERERILEKAMADEPSNPGPFRLAASDAYRNGNYRRAIELAERSFALDQDQETKESTLDVLIQAAFSMRDAHRAEKYLSLKRSMDPYDFALEEQEETLQTLKSEQGR